MGAVIIKAKALEAFVADIFVAAGSSQEESSRIGRYLVSANLSGHDSHGVIRVQPYVGLLRAGRTTTGKSIKVTKDAGALITVDGQEGLGQVVCKQAIDLAIGRAREHGVAVQGLCNSAHMGRIGAWAEQAAAAGMDSPHFCNTTGFGIQVAPFGGTDRRLSVNPIAMGVPRTGQEPIIHDMSTGTIAAGKVRVARNKGARLPEGSLIDNQGRPSTDPEAFFTNPPGAITTAAGHKGYGLAVFVEILAGSLTAGGLMQAEAGQAARTAAKAKSCILVYLWGGPPQQDMWDMKPDAPEGIRSEFKPIDTNVAGIQICDQLPQVARHADKFCIVRALTHPSNTHEVGVYHTLTGKVNNTLAVPRNKRSRSDFPNAAAIVSRFTPLARARLVVVSSFMSPPWLGG